MVQLPTQEAFLASIIAQSASTQFKNRMTAPSSFQTTCKHQFSLDVAKGWFEDFNTCLSCDTKLYEYPDGDEDEAEDEADEADENDRFKNLPAHFRAEFDDHLKSHGAYHQDKDKFIQIGILGFKTLLKANRSTRLVHGLRGLNPRDLDVRKLIAAIFNADDSNQNEEHTDLSRKIRMDLVPMLAFTHGLIRGRIQQFLWQFGTSESPLFQQRVKVLMSAWHAMEVYIRTHGRKMQVGELLTGLFILWYKQNTGGIKRLPEYEDGEEPGFKEDMIVLFEQSVRFARDAEAEGERCRRKRG